MKKLVLFFLMISLITPAINAQTYVGGPIYANAAWTLTGSPYILQSNNIAVMTGATLTIDAGVTVKFDTARAIQVFGTLRALGTTSQPILFTSLSSTPLPGDWGYILFNNSSTPYNFSNGSGSILSHCTIEYAGGANPTFNGALRLDNAKPYINNCSIHQCNKQAIKIWNLTGSIYIDSCDIQNNTADTGIVYIRGNASSRATIRNSVINNNISTVLTANNFKIGGIYSAICNVSIKNSSISYNNGQGIMGYLKNSISDTILYCQINYNTGNGIYYYLPLSNNHITITNSTIINNLLNGFCFFYNSNISNNTCTITNNTINDNVQNGLFYSCYSSQTSTSDTYIFGNNIINNNLSNGVCFYYYWSASSQFTFTNNIISNNAQNGILLNHSDNSSSNTFSINNNTINNNALNGTFYESYYSNNNGYTCTLNNINNNLQNGIYIYNYSYRTTNNIYTITYDTINNNSFNGICYYYPSLAYNNTFTIMSNIIYRNLKSGIILSCIHTSGTVYSPNILNISENKIVGNFTNGGISVLNNTPGTGVNTTLTHNIIADNVNLKQGGGIFIKVVKGSTTMTNNHIVSNYSDTTSALYIKSPGFVTANYNTIVNNRAFGTAPQRTVYFEATDVVANPQFRYNNIYNYSCTNPFYELWENSFNGDSLNARNCYWQHQSIPGVDSLIYDYFDNSNLGITWFYPFDTTTNITAPVTPVQNVTKTDLGGGNIQVSWTPNIETDVTGYKVYWGSPSGYSFSNSTNVGNVTSHTLSGMMVTDTIEVTAYDNNSTGLNDQINGFESWFSGGNSALPIVLEDNMPYNTICFGGSSGQDASFTVWGAFNNTYEFFMDGISVQGPGTSNIYSADTLSNGQHIIYAIGTNACGTDTSNYDTITVNPIPVAGNGNYNVCLGQSVQIGTAPVFGCTYSWSPATYLNNPNIANPIAIPLTNENYTLTVVDTLPGCTNSNTGNYQIILGYTMVNLGNDTTICTTQSLNLNAGNHSSYLWSPNGQTTSTIIVNGSTLGQGIYTFAVQVTDTCTNSDTIVVTVSICPGILESESGNNKITVYPNPTEENITILTPEKTTIQILTIHGQLIKTLAASGNKTNIDHVGYSSYVVDVSALPAGIYIVQVKTEKGVGVRKFVKE